MKIITYLGAARDEITFDGPLREAGSCFSQCKSHYAGEAAISGIIKRDAIVTVN